jgi:hypothetical protein
LPWTLEILHRITGKKNPFLREEKDNKFTGINTYGLSDIDDCCGEK